MYWYHICNGDPYNPTPFDFQNTILLGMPSSDGRGPSAHFVNSVGISAQASNPDACWEFVKILFSDDVQDFIATG